MRRLLCRACSGLHSARVRAPMACCSTAVCPSPGPGLCHLVLCCHVATREGAAVLVGPPLPPSSTTPLRPQATPCSCCMPQRRKAVHASLAQHTRARCMHFSRHGTNYTTHPTQPVTILGVARGLPIHLAGGGDHDTMPTSGQARPLPRGFLQPMGLCCICMLPARTALTPAAPAAATASAAASHTVHAMPG